MYGLMNTRFRSLMTREGFSSLASIYSDVIDEYGEKGLRLIGRTETIPVAFTPIVVPDSLVEYLRWGATVLNNVQSKLMWYLFTDSHLQKLLSSVLFEGWSGPALQLISTPYWDDKTPSQDRLIRYDMFVNPLIWMRIQSGELSKRSLPRVVRLIEPNNNSVEGWNLIPLSSEAISEIIWRAGGVKLPTIDFTPHLYDWVTRGYWDKVGSGTPKVAVIWWKGGASVKDTELPHVVAKLAQYGRREGVSVVGGSIEDVELRSGKVFVAGQEVNAIWRNTGPEGYLEREYTGAARDFFTILTNPPEHVWIGNPPSGKTRGNKTIMALMHHPDVQKILTETEKAVVKLFVPWTAPMWLERWYRGKEISVLEYALRHKDDLVHKPALGSHGSGVTIGYQVSDEEWEQALKDRSAPYLIQEAVDYVQHETFVRNGGNVTTSSLYHDYNVPVFGGIPMPELPVVRMCESRLLNVAGRMKAGIGFGLPESFATDLLYRLWSRS